MDFSKSNSRLRKVILGSARILVFSLTCEKSNSRTDENCHIRGEKHTIRVSGRPAARSPGRLAARTLGRPPGRTPRLTARMTVRRPSAPAGQPNQTKNNVTPTIVRLWELLFSWRNVILMTSRFTEFSVSVRKVILVARRIVTNKNYCLFLLTKIGRNKQFSYAMEKSN